MISIIVPCYNVATTILRTIDSVEHQTNKDYELILVNDGSTDNTWQIISAYAEDKPNVKSIDKTNGGVSSARNAGIKAAQGEYLYFLDGDDLISPNLVQELANAAGPDMLVFGYSHDRGNRIDNKIPQPQADFLKSYLLGKVFVLQCSFAISRTLVNTYRIQLDENTYYSEDIEFIVKCLILAKSVLVIPIVMFHYMYNDASVTHVKCPYNSRNITSVRATQRIYNLVQSQRSDIANIALMRYQLVVLMHLGFYYKTGGNDLSLLSELKNHAKILHRNSHVYWNKYAIYVQVMRIVWNLSPALFVKLVRFL